MFKALRRWWKYLGAKVNSAFNAKADPKIQLEQAKGFSLFLLRAIINGRGDEVIELARTNLRR